MGVSILFFACSRLCCRTLCSQTLKTLQELVRCGIREDQADRYHALGLGLVAPDLLIKSGVCKRYRDVTVYAADAVGEDLFFVQRVFKWRPCW